MARNYGRDLDIGTPRTEQDVNVKNFIEVTAKIEDTTSKIEEANEELKKIRVGTELTIEEEIEEVE